MISLLDIDRQGEELYKVDGKRYEQSEEVRQNLYDTIDRVYSFIGFLTIRDLLSIFPIRKITMENYTSVRIIFIQ